MNTQLFNFYFWWKFSFSRFLVFIFFNYIEYLELVLWELYLILSLSEEKKIIAIISYICRRRRQLKWATNLTILFPQPRRLLIIVKQAKKIERCILTWRESAAAAVTQISGCFTDFRDDFSSLYFRLLLRGPCSIR